MSDQKPMNGGPAFPHSELLHSHSGYSTKQPGMTLRDYFAAQIAAAIYTQFKNDGTAREYDYWREGVAVEAYRLADEMLDVRERAPGSDGAREDSGNG